VGERVAWFGYSGSGVQFAGVLAACAPRRARGPANAHVGPL